VTPPSELVLVGASHRTAPIDVRERLALSRERSGELLAALVAEPGVDEALVLSTCGRTELYALVSDPDEAAPRLLANVAGGSGLPPADLSATAHTARGREVVEHLFRVASGLESMALGEVEILGQLRRAGEDAEDARARGPVLGRLIDHALATGRRVRAETTLGRGRSSLGSAVVGAARRHLPRGDAPALVIGSGVTGAKTARALQAAGFEITVLAGRRAERAGRLAAEVCGRVASRQALGPLLERVDLVVSCTGAPHHLVSAGMLADVVARRNGRELLAIDLSVPRDIDPAAREVPGVHLYDLDELQDDVRTTAAVRSAAIPAAEAIVAAEAERFIHWAAARAVVPTIKELRGHSERAVLAALRTSDLAADADEDLLRAAGEAIVTRLLHTPTYTLRAAAEAGDAVGLIHSVRRLFELDSRAAASGIP
jgi:glutamyl-tRNA reductase